MTKESIGLLFDLLKNELEGEWNHDIISNLWSILNKDEPVFKWNIEPGSEIKEEVKITTEIEMKGMAQQTIEEEWAAFFGDTDLEECK